jgi:hypothetical protein
MAEGVQFVPKVPVPAWAQEAFKERFGVEHITRLPTPFFSASLEAEKIAPHRTNPNAYFVLAVVKVTKRVDSGEMVEFDNYVLMSLLELGPADGVCKILHEFFDGRSPFVGTQFPATLAALNDYLDVTRKFNLPNQPNP